MALADKEYSRMYSITGSDADKVDSDLITRMEEKFTNNDYINDGAMFEEQGIVFVQLQKIMDEFDEIRRHLENDVGDGAKGDTGATGPQGPKGDTGATGADGTTDASKLDASKLPTSKPKTSGLLYNDKGIVKVS